MFLCAYERIWTGCVIGSGSMLFLSTGKIKQEKKMENLHQQTLNPHITKQPIVHSVDVSLCIGKCSSSKLGKLSFRFSLPSNCWFRYSCCYYSVTLDWRPHHHHEASWTLIKIARCENRMHPTNTRVDARVYSTWYRAPFACTAFVQRSHTRKFDAHLANSRFCSVLLRVCALCSYVRLPISAVD